MRKFTSNLAFVDLLFNLLVGFTSMFIIAFLLINPVAEEGKSDPRVEFMILLEWDSASTTDVDLWVKGPDGKVVGYTAKEHSFMTLSRDDLVVTNDYYTKHDGDVGVIRRNLEEVKIRAIVPGEYIVNVHYYSPGKDADIDKEETATVTLIDMEPSFRRVAEVDRHLTYKSEQTAFIFNVSEEGIVTEVITDLNVRIRPAGGWSAGELETGTSIPYDPDMSEELRQ